MVKVFNKTKNTRSRTLFDKNGDLALNFGRHKGKKLSQLPLDYLTTLSNKNHTKLNWVNNIRAKFPDTVEGARNYLKNNSLCFKCGKKVNSRGYRSKIRTVLGLKIRTPVKDRKVHKNCFQRNRIR